MFRMAGGRGCYPRDLGDTRKRSIARTSSVVAAVAVLSLGASGSVGAEAASAGSAGTKVASAELAGLSQTTLHRRADPGARTGTYVGKTQGHYRASFKIQRGGRKLARFKTSVVAYYTGPGGVRPEVVPVRFSAAKVSRTGKFSRTYRHRIASDGSTLTVTVRGNIDRGRLKRGRIAYYHNGDGYEVRTDGPQPFTARRR